MAYGLYVEGGNGVLQIDSESSYMEALEVKTKTSISAGILTGVKEGDSVFFRAQPAENSSVVIWPHQTASTNGTFNIEFKGQAYPNGTIGNIAVDVINLGKVSTSTATPSGNYGLQIFSGTNTIFDSRLITSGFTITNYVPKGSVNGDPSIGTRISTALGPYVSTIPGRYGSNSNNRRGFVFSNVGSSVGIRYYHILTGNNTNEPPEGVNNFEAFTIGEAF